MELLVLDASGSWLAPGNGTSGYLLTLDGFNLWIDLGTGTLARLGEHIPDHSVDAAVISYAQPDNRVDLHMLYYARAFHPEPLPKLPLFTPPGAFDRIAAGAGGRLVLAHLGGHDSSVIFGRRVRRRPARTAPPSRADVRSM
jgi:ribonuclease BN (tRNA processing enzyme)